MAIKLLFSPQIGIPPEKFRFCLHGKILNENSNAKEASLYNGCTLEITLGLNGGKS